MHKFTLEIEYDDESLPLSLPVQCLHCVLSLVIQDWMRKKDVTLTEAIMATAEVISDMISSNPSENTHEQALAAIVTYLKDSVETKCGDSNEKRPTSH